MENFRISAGLLVIYLMWLTMDARGQAFKDPLSVRPGQTVHSTHLVEKVRKIYTSQIGVREKANNSGKEVEEYLKYVKLQKGNPWCAAFVCWVYGRAGVGNPRSGWSPALFGEGRVIWVSGEPRTKSQDSRLPQSEKDPSADSYRLRPRRTAPLGRGAGDVPNVPSTYGSSLATGNWQRVTPGPGDVFGLYFPEKARIAHVGFIDEWKDPWVVTVEGNTNVLGSRDGDGVYRKRRLVRSVYKVARYVD